MSTRVGYGQRRVFVSPEAFEMWLVNEGRVRTNLPDDARFVRLWEKDDGSCYIMVFESSEWDELEEGEQIPKLEVVAEAIEEDGDE